MLILFALRMSSYGSHLGKRWWGSGRASRLISRWLQGSDPGWCGKDQGRDTHKRPKRRRVAWGRYSPAGSRGSALGTRGPGGWGRRGWAERRETQARLGHTLSLCSWESEGLGRQASPRCRRPRRRGSAGRVTRPQCVPCAGRRPEGSVLAAALSDTRSASPSRRREGEVSGRMRKRQDLNPGLWLLAACSLCVPQTVAECVLYYYLTKKNENYKSLVRRSYRRRGKSQVRGGRARLWGLVPGVPCGRWREGGGWRVTVSARAAARRARAPSGAAGRPCLGVFGPPQRQRGAPGERPLPFPSLENSRTPGLVNRDPRGEKGHVPRARTGFSG